MRMKEDWFLKPDHEIRRLRDVKKSETASTDLNLGPQLHTFPKKIWSSHGDEALRGGSPCDPRRWISSEFSLYKDLFNTP